MASKLRQVVERLYSELHDRELSDWVTEQRRDGRSWARIARDLEESIGVELTDVTLMTWFSDRDAA